MTNAVFDKIDITPFPGERVLWSHVQKGIDKHDTPAPYRWGWFLLSTGLFGYGIYQIATSKEAWTLTYILGVAAFFATIVLIFKFGPALLARLPFNTEQTAFMSCVITTDRILLLDFEGAPVRSLDRRSLKSAAVDFVQGGRALVFRSDTPSITYAFIANIDHHPALQALDTPRKTP